MANPKNKFRFAIGEGQELYSEVWTIWQNRADIYLTSKSFGGRIKLSLHQSGVCQYAFTKDFFDANSSILEPGFSDRTWHRWRRAISKEMDFLHTVSVIFSSSETWNLYEEKNSDDIFILPPPPHGYSFEVQLSFSAVKFEEFITRNPVSPIAKFELTSGEYLNVFAFFVELPRNYFDFKKVDGGIVEIGEMVYKNGYDAKGISVIALHQSKNGPFEIHSKHNMRLLRVKKGAPIPRYERVLPWWDLLGRFRMLFPPRAK